MAETKEIHLSLATLAVHADDGLMNHGASDVAPALHVSTNFRYTANRDQLKPADEQLSSPRLADAHVYSRETAPNSTRLEELLTPLISADIISYTSGLAALHAAYVLLKPRRVAIGNGYHGSHGVLKIHKKLTGAAQLPLDCAPEALEEGDLIHLETPVNPTGEAFCIKAYADKAHSRGAYLLVDATFALPPLQDPFMWGADLVLHSGTKYLGGHSDMLCGVLATRKGQWVDSLRRERTYLGAVMGNMEAWLGLRSIRTLPLRIERQSSNAQNLIEWLSSLLNSNSLDKTVESIAYKVRMVVSSIHHASLQGADMHWLKRQMPRGFGPVFAITMKHEKLARVLPGECSLFCHATSLGAVESLMEWRAMSDESVDRCLVRVSVGIEAWEDLRADLLCGLLKCYELSCNEHLHRSES